jgi:anti-sigma B factor antagonist
MEGFSIKIDYYPENNEIVIIKLVGYVDQSNSHQIQKVIADLLQSKKQKFVFDLTELIYMSSAGWGIFVGEVKTVREIGGDIKVSCMSPEIYDVFQVLEFYHILEDYPTVDDAVTSFIENGNGSIEMLLQDKITEDEPDEKDAKSTGTKKRRTRKKNKEEEPEPEPEAKPKPQLRRLRPSPKSTSAGPGSMSNRSEATMDLAKLPLTEKIKKIIAVYPLINIWQINKMLRHDKFGAVKINPIKLYRMLRLLNLHTKKNRFRYYRSV